jgi:hypothetical protein
VAPACLSNKTPGQCAWPPRSQTKHARRAHSRTPGSGFANKKNVPTVRPYVKHTVGKERFERITANCRPAPCFMLGPPRRDRQDRSPRFINVSPDPGAVDTDPPRRNKTTCHQHITVVTPSSPPPFRADGPPPYPHSLTKRTLKLKSMMRQDNLARQPGRQQKAALAGTGREP